MLAPLHSSLSEWVLVRSSGHSFTWLARICRYNIIIDPYGSHDDYSTMLARSIFCAAVPGKLWEWGIPQLDPRNNHRFLSR
jgi:hypothetical protein